MKRISLLVALAQSVIIPKDQATQFLRQKRASGSWHLEELWSGNLERECFEESCNFDEFVEIFKDEGHTVLSDDCQDIVTLADRFDNVPSDCLAGLIGRSIKSGNGGESGIELEEVYQRFQVLGRKADRCRLNHFYLFSKKDGNLKFQV